MRIWIRRQLTVQNLLIVCTLVATLFLNTGRSIVGLTREQDERTSQIAGLLKATAMQTDEVRALAARVDALERANLQLFEIVAREFPRRSELEPRLKAIEENIAETNRLIRRGQEQFRR